MSYSNTPPHYTHLGVYGVVPCHVYFPDVETPQFAVVRPVWKWLEPVMTLQVRILSGLVNLVQEFKPDYEHTFRVHTFYEFETPKVLEPN